MAHRQPDGTPLRVHLQRAAMATGRADPQLLRRAPAAGSQVWEVFCELTALRPPGGPIPLAEVEAWQRLQGVQLTGWEVECITAMDAAARTVAEELQRKARPQ